MKIILSQKIDTVSTYKDIPFKTYHFPKKYIKKIATGDMFIYYQGNRHKRSHRYYFGVGVIGKIDADSDGEHFYAEILDGIKFKNVVPIYEQSASGYIEDRGFEDLRNQPDWNNSIRPISDSAFEEILKIANVAVDNLIIEAEIERATSPLETINALNKKLSNHQPAERNKKIENHLDRGISVTRALKEILGSKCQICNWEGFAKKKSKRAKYNESFIEAHHVDQIANLNPRALCSDNIILLCPNCHREVHYGEYVRVVDHGKSFEISLSNKIATIQKNTIEYLEKIESKLIDK